MADEMTSIQDIEKVIRLTIENVDLKTSLEIEKLRGEVVRLVDDKITACQEKQTKRRRFSISAIISVLGAMVALASLVASRI